MKPGLIGDLFAGGGGTSAGLAAAFEREPDFAINHDPTAIAVHAANHPKTKHLLTDIWATDPKTVCKGRHLMFLWASPDCTHFSVAKGGKPRKQNIRSLAHVVVEWARDVRPDVIMVENVAEFLGWGPLDANGHPIKARMGETFQQWKGRLELLGYQVDHRVLDASLYGAPTRRRRLFLIARCDGEPIVWPEATHGPGKLPVHTAAECIDWSLPCPSIFDRKKPLAEKTLWRIAQGIKRFVLENPTPFIVGAGGRARQTNPASVDQPLGTVTAKNDRALVTPVLATIDHRGTESTAYDPAQPLKTTTTKNRHALIAPTLVQTSYGERPGQRPRYLDLHQPLGTVVAQGQKHALVAAFLSKHYGDPRRTDGGGGVVLGSELSAPIGTVTARDHHSVTAATLVKMRGDNHGADLAEPMPVVSAQGTHLAEVRAFLTAYYGEDGTGGQAVTDPMRTITSRHRLGLVTVAGTEYQIVDIGFRMLEPHELLRAQFGRFAEGYDLSAATSKRDQVRLIGNSVCPELVEQLVRANLTKRERRAA